MQHATHASGQGDKIASDSPANPWTFLVYLYTTSDSKLTPTRLGDKLLLLFKTFLDLVCLSDEIRSERLICAYSELNLLVFLPAWEGGK